VASSAFALLILYSEDGGNVFFRKVKFTFSGLHGIIYQKIEILNEWNDHISPSAPSIIMFFMENIEEGTNLQNKESAVLVPFC
jgi:hypothetical protein